MKSNELLFAAENVGFEYYGILNVSTIRLLPEVRNMCRSNSCGMYGKNWSCPPGCGTLEECRIRISRFETGLIVQTVSQIDDSFDIEGMMKSENKHKSRFMKLWNILGEKYDEILPLGTGACTICEKCTYPSAPCRFKNKAVSSLESYGILVSQLCTDNGLAYYYGLGTISYTSCLLLPLYRLNERKA